MPAFVIPLSIVLGSSLIAGAIYFSNFSSAPSAPSAAVPNNAAPQRPVLPTVVEGVNLARAENRHLYGNPEAQITIIEFSDYECPFCARLHPTLKRIVDESDGSINWEYRHLPLPMHSGAVPAAIASECVARELGNDAFWKFTDVLFANIGKANASFLKAEAGKLGATAATYDACISDSSVKALVDADAAALIEEFGQQGTPFSLIVDNRTGTGRPIVGALPYENWQQALAALGS